jgi:hypothetical protein
VRPVPILPVVVVEIVLGQSLSSETTDVPHGGKWWTRERTDGQGALYPSAVTYAVAWPKLLVVVPPTGSTCAFSRVQTQSVFDCSMNHLGPDNGIASIATSADP